MVFNSTLVLIVLAVYLAFMLYLGFYFKKRTNTFGEFILGNRGIPWFVIAMTMLATLANAQQTLGIAGTSYALGLSPMIWFFLLVNIFIYPLLVRLGSRYRHLQFDTIVDLAQRMIDFYWKDETRALGVEFSGLRPGEKLEEHLVYPFEEADTTTHPLVKRVCARDGIPSGNGAGDHFERLVRDLVSLAEDHGPPREIIAARTATLQGDGSYKLSDILRGQQEDEGKRSG